MKTPFLTSVLILLFVSILSAQTVPPDSLYFGQAPPGGIPHIFAPGMVSLPGRREATITFSPDGASVFFHIQFYPQPGTPYTLFSTYTDHWTIPDTIPFTLGRTTAEPSFAYNGTRLYMYATNTINQVGAADLSYSEKQGNNWSTPISMGNPPNSDVYQYHPCIVGDTSVFFSSSAGDICRCQYNNGAYQSRITLPVPVNHIGSQTWGDPYVTADESYMILKSIRTEGYGQNDLYIAYKKTDATWTNPKNLGNIINTPGDEYSGDITPDGLYMTYGRNNDLYWVSTSFIDSLKYTNYIPYVKHTIPNQTAIQGELFTYTIPDSTFFDDDGMNTLTCHAKLTNGAPLPAWLTFDTIGGTFTGTPPIAEILNIKVTATDTAAAATSTTFKITITPYTSTEQINVQNNGVRIFPNPANGSVNIYSEVLAGKSATIEIISPDGKVILMKPFENNMTIDLTGRPVGIYILKLFNGHEMIVRKFVLSN